jgi:4-hydroxy-4-methyl-2-oxoglutarate aldolase
MQIEEIQERLKRLETSCLCDAKKTLRCLDPAIRPLSLGLKLVGRAFTVACCNDFLTVIKALHDASPGDVLVVDGQQGRTALAGELFSTEAKRKGLAGMVVDGAVRDVATIRAMQFPVYCETVAELPGLSSPCTMQ